MAIVTIRELVEAGVHFGHRASRWNPKMEHFIFGKKNDVHVVDLRQTVRQLMKASAFLESVGAVGEVEAGSGDDRVVTA